jgi:hypothetical protein
MPHKYVTKVVWYILVQLSSLQASGRWPLAACLWVGQQQEAKNKIMFFELLTSHNTMPYLKLI